VQSLSDPLNLLHQDGSWFARAHELRLWLVRHDENLRAPVLTLLPKLEFHADNFSAWPVLPDPHTKADRGWQPRANRLAEDWQRRVEAFAEQGITQGAVIAVQSPRALDAFRATAAAIGKSMVEPLRGLVVVLAPTIVEDPVALESALTELMGDPALQHCRWVLALDLDVPPPRVLLDALGPEHSLTTVCRVDEAQQKRDLEAMIGDGEPARFGVAGPVGVVAPKRVDDPPPLPKEVRDEELRRSGIEPALFDRAAEIRVKVLQASIAMKEGRGPEAVLRQREARDLYTDVGKPDLWVILQVTLASYLSGTGQRALAKRELQLAIEQARAHQLGRLEAQSHLALGMLHALDDEAGDAIRSYTEAARVAEQADERVLAIEAWRTAGQLAVGHGQDQPAANALQQALRLAGEVAPAAV
jgi:tetratricopeptide (TPR) repeat protein